MAEMVDFGPKEGTFVQVTERNRTVLCPVPGRAHAIVARAIVVQALAPYLVVGVLWAPAVDRLCYGFAPIPMDFTRFNRQISTSGSKLFECQRAQFV